MGETRRLKGEPNLEAELREAADEFHLLFRRRTRDGGGLRNCSGAQRPVNNKNPVIQVIPQVQRQTATSWTTRAMFFLVFLVGSASADLEWPLVIDTNCNWPYASAGRGSLPGWAIALMAIQSLVLLVLLVRLCCLPCLPLHRWLACKLRAIFGRRACEDVEQQQKGGHSLENNLLAENCASK
ncbi:hypothetical protein niasHT_013171 [Heterodera trifolii]|uniref:Uncharacterized protein n=1 Tax=Heterodera trifolii TaxID=157864 RepID=A0ABD2KTR3_9BILA